MDQIKLPGDAKLAAKLIEGQLRHEQSKIDRGFLGGFLGGRSNVPFNIAGFIAATSSIVLLIAVVRWAGSADFTYKDGVASLSSLISLTIGYLFGRGTRD